MIITDYKYNKPKYNIRAKNAKENHLHLKKEMGTDCFVNLTNKPQISFGGIFDIFSTKANINKDINKMSAEEILKTEQKVTSEIFELISKEELDDKTIKRVQQLCESDFLDFNAKAYRPTETGDMYLRDIYYQIGGFTPNSRGHILFVASSFDKRFKTDEYGALATMLLSYQEVSEDGKLAKIMRDKLEKLEINNFMLRGHNIISLIKNPRANRKLLEVIAQKATDGEKYCNLDKFLAAGITIQELFDNNFDKNFYSQENLWNYGMNYSPHFEDKENRTVENIIRLATNVKNSPHQNTSLNFRENVIDPLMETLTDEEGEKFIHNLFESAKLADWKDLDVKTNPYMIIFSAFQQKFNTPEKQALTDKYNQIRNQHGFPEFEIDFSPRTIYAFKDKAVQKKIYDILIKDFENNVEVYSTKDFIEASDRLKSIEQRCQQENAYDWAPFIVENLPHVFLRKQNRQDFEQIVKDIENVNADYNYKDITGNTFAHLAATSENPILLEFAVKKGMAFDVYNDAGKSVFDLVEQYSPHCPQLKEITDSIRTPAPELFKMIDKNLPSGLQLLLEDKHIDINTKDPKTGETPWLRAATLPRYQILRILSTHPEINVNAVDNKGNNAGLLAVKSGNLDNIRELNQVKDFDINYINPLNGESVFSLTDNVDILKEALKNPKANPNVAIEGFYPPIFKRLQKIVTENRRLGTDNSMNLINILMADEKFDLNQTYKGVSIEDFMVYNNMSSKLLKKLSASHKERFINGILKQIEEVGELTFEQIKQYITYPNVDKTMLNRVLNDINEPIGFYIADIRVNKKNLNDYIKLLDTLKDNGYDFGIKNKFEQTLLDKAKYANHKFLIEYLENNIGKNENRNK